MPRPVSRTSAGHREAVKKAEWVGTALVVKVGLSAPVDVVVEQDV